MAAPTTPGKSSTGTSSTSRTRTSSSADDHPVHADERRGPHRAPLHILELRERGEPFEEEQRPPNDYHAAREAIKDANFAGDNLSKTQLAILSLIPPNERILGTLKLNQSTQVIDMDFVRKQIQKDTIRSNKKVWERYSEALISAAFAQKLLETQGGDLDFGVEDVEIPEFDPASIRNPVYESERIPKELATTHAHSSSSLSQSLRAEAMRKPVGPDSVLGMNTTCSAPSPPCATAWRRTTRAAASALESSDQD